MLLSRPLILRLFRAFSIQRWNDQIRPLDLVEMDKHAHKMATAYCLGRSAEEAGHKVDWNNLIRGGIFELLRRSVLSDIKSPIYRQIKTDHPAEFRQLSAWVYEQLAEETDANHALLDELRRYLVDGALLDEISADILQAAHLYASSREFEIIRTASPETDETEKIVSALRGDLHDYEAPSKASAAGLSRLREREAPDRFLDLFARLRFQVRWGSTPRLPVTSVLGHSMMVATMSYLLTRELATPACEKRLKNNFFGGLFHDIPEAVTRDIIAPVKKAIPALESIIRKIETGVMENQILPLLPPSWHEELRYYAGTPRNENEKWDEFSSKTMKDGVITVITPPEAIPNEDQMNPVDGCLIEVADHLAAFVEAQKSIEAGVSTPDLADGAGRLRHQYEHTKVLGINIGSIYKGF